MSETTTALEKSDSFQRVEQHLMSLITTPEIRERFISVALQQVRLSKALRECTPDSILAGIVRMAQLGLDPAIPNECWLVPFKGQASFIVGYGGLRKLVLRSPEVRDVFAAAVCEHDDYEHAANPLSLPTHRRAGGFRPRGRAVGYYAAALLTIGHWRVVEMSRAEVHAHKQRYSRSADSTFWSEGAPDQEGLSNFDKMALKTVLRQLCSPRNFSLTPGISEALTREEALYANNSLPAGDSWTAMYAARTLTTSRESIPQLSAGSEHGENLGESATTAAEELFGKERVARDAERATLHDRIEALVVQIEKALWVKGFSPSDAVDWWGKVCSESGVDEPEQLPIQMLESCLAVARELSRKHTTPSSSVGATAPQLGLIERINAAMAEHGLADAVIAQYWASQFKRFRVESAEAFTPTQLEGLHAEVRARLAKRAERVAQEDHAPEEATTEAADTTDDLPEFGGGMAAEESQQHEYANQQE